MTLLYSPSNRITFTSIPQSYGIKRAFRAKQSDVHSAVILYVMNHYKNTKKYQQKIVDALNRLTYCILENELPSFNWKSTDPINTMPDIDEQLVADTLGNLYLTIDAIEWDVQPTDNMLDSGVTPTVSNVIENPEVEINVEPKVVEHIKSYVKDTQKAVYSKSTKTSSQEDLSVKLPVYPTFDVSKLWVCEGLPKNIVIHPTLPEIPTKQNEVSITTDVNKMTDSELVALYPDHLIRTRRPAFYNEYEGLGYDEQFGTILPISQFSQEDVLDNIIKYPHLYNITRKIGNEYVPFQKYIEINGELLETQEVWNTLPESLMIPKDITILKDFIKDYVIRRYLLERDHGIKHKYEMANELDPFLTLVMPSSDYIRHGYTDIVDLARKCVKSRVRYKQSRNPALRGMQASKSCLFTGHCIEHDCNMSCPILAQSSYLLERNYIGEMNPVFKMSSAKIKKNSELLNNVKGKIATIVVNSGEFTSQIADDITYCGICNSWYGSCFHCVVFNLRFNKYLETIQNSWSSYGGEGSDKAAPLKIWANTARVLIISSLDFVNFKDFQSQSLLTLLQTRMNPALTTIVVTPPLDSLVGEGRFFPQLTSLLGRWKVRYE